MSDFKAWRVGSSNELTSLPEVNLEKEERLEDLIEAKSSLLSPGLTIIGRQVPVSVSGQTTSRRIDLLALDSQSRLTVIELKNAPATFDAVMQGLQYAIMIHHDPGQLKTSVEKYARGKGKSLEEFLGEKELSLQELDSALEATNLEVHLIVAGIGKSKGVESINNFLDSHPGITTAEEVAFRCFKNLDGDVLIIRELDESTSGVLTDSKENAAVKKKKYEKLLAKFERAGLVKQFEQLNSIAKKLDLYPRYYKNSVMHTPDSNRSTCMFTLRISGEELYVGHSLSNLEAFLGISQQETINKWGETENWWRLMDAGCVEEFCSWLEGAANPEGGSE